MVEERMGFGGRGRGKWESKRPVAASKGAERI
jgi:hypothetical protein